MAKLFEPLKIKDIIFKNRIFVSPMCQYSAVDGIPNDWHLVHLGARASGGASLVIVEATGVSPEGRISVGCTGLWNEEQEHSFCRIVKFIKSQNSIAGIQLAHAGRKASSDVAWKGGKNVKPEDGGWEVVGPSPIAFSKNYPVPKELSKEDIGQLIKSFVEATERAIRAGFEVLEIHMAHGYLLHQFLSPLSNKRQDEFGGSLENRMRFPLMVAKAVREVWPLHLPLFTRISATDWVEGGWDIEQSVVLCQELKKIGIDLIDASSGGSSSDPKIPTHSHYQVPFAKEIKNRVDILTGAVGLITSPTSAQKILEDGDADVILVGRELLRDPYWPIRAAKELDEALPVPPQYLRAF